MQAISRRYLLNKCFKEKGLISFCKGENICPQWSKMLAKTTLSKAETEEGESSGLVVRRRSQEVRHLSSIPASPKCLVPRIQKGANTPAVSGSALAVSFREL